MIPGVTASGIIALAGGDSLDLLQAKSVVGPGDTFPTSTVDITFDATPDSGHLLVAVVGVRYVGGGDSSIDIPGDFVLDKQQGSSTTTTGDVNLVIASKVSDGTEGTLTFGWDRPAGQPARGVVWIAEFDLSGAVLDKVAGDTNDGGGSQSTGTTATTAEAVELAVAAVVFNRSGTSTSVGPWTNSFTQQLALPTVIGGGAGCTLVIGTKELSATGTVETTTPWNPGGQTSCGAVATYA
jgi:hypothetical protein